MAVPSNTLTDSIRQVEGVGKIQDEFREGKILAAIAAAAFFGFTAYAIHLNIKNTRLNIKKLNSEGFH